jgi:hypothetical protein
MKKTNYSARSSSFFASLVLSLVQRFLNKYKQKVFQLKQKHRLEKWKQDFKSHLRTVEQSQNLIRKSEERLVTAFAKVLSYKDFESLSQ